MIGIVTMHNSYYTDLSNVTYNQNLVEYANLHKYKLFCKTDGFSTEYQIYFDKIKFMIDSLSDSEIEWIWWLDSDAIVTNFHTKLESIIDNQYHVILSTDFNGINAGSILVKNSPQGKAWLEVIYAHRFFNKIINHKWPEQIVMMETAKNYTDIIKIVPQKIFNSYYYSLYDKDYGTPIAVIFGDRLKTDGNWTPGDFVIHFPGMPNIIRIEYIKLFLKHSVLKPQQ